MQNRFVKLAFICLLLMLFSCKKESNPPRYHVQNHSPHLSYPFIKTNDRTADPTFTYYYDTLGRLVTDGYYLYTYSPDSVYMNGFALYGLNSSGYANYIVEGNQVCTYDSAGFLIASNIIGTNYQTIYYYQNNNLVTTVQIGDSLSGSDGQLKYDVTFYSYNSGINTIGNYNSGIPYLGRSSVNLLDSCRTVEAYVSSNNFSVSEFYNSPPNYTITRVTNSYTYNNSGYVASCTSTYSIYQDGPTYTTTSTSTYSYY